MKTYEVEIEGITPLMMNRILEPEEIPKKQGEAFDSQELAHKKVYKVGDKIVVPSEWIIRAMQRVAGEFRVEGMKKTTYKQLLPGNVFIEPEFIEIDPQEYVIDKRTVVIPTTRGRVWRYRPKWPKWKLKFKIKVFDERIKQEVLNHILVEAGRRVGIGDGRSIGFGRFIVTKFEQT